MACLQSLLPRRLLKRAREDWLHRELIQPPADGLLVVLPSLTGSVVDKGALAKRVRRPGRLGCQRTAGRRGSVLVHERGGVASKGVRPRGRGLQRGSRLLLRLKGRVGARVERR